MNVEENTDFLFFFSDNLVTLAQKVQSFEYQMIPSRINSFYGSNCMFWYVYPQTGNNIRKKTEKIECLILSQRSETGKEGSTQSKARKSSTDGVGGQMVFSPIQSSLSPREPCDCAGRSHLLCIAMLCPRQQ